MNAASEVALSFCVVQDPSPQNDDCISRVNLLSVSLIQKPPQRRTQSLVSLMILDLSN